MDFIVLVPDNVWSITALLACDSPKQSYVDHQINASTILPHGPRGINAVAYVPKWVRVFVNDFPAVTTAQSISPRNNANLKKFRVVIIRTFFSFS